MSAAFQTVEMRSLAPPLWKQPVLRFSESLVRMSADDSLPAGSPGSRFLGLPDSIAGRVKQVHPAATSKQFFLGMPRQPERARAHARLVERMRVRRNTRLVPPVFRIGNATAIGASRPGELFSDRHGMVEHNSRRGALIRSEQGDVEDHRE